MSPTYWETYAPELETASKGLDFSGKTVRVISTHEGSGLASMVRDIKKNCKGDQLWLVKHFQEEI